MKMLRVSYRLLVLCLILISSKVHCQTPMTEQEMIETETFARNWLVAKATRSNFQGSFSSAYGDFSKALEDFSKALDDLSNSSRAFSVFHLDEHIVVLGSQRTHCGIILIRSLHNCSSEERVLAYSTESIIRPSTNSMKQLISYYEKVAQIICQKKLVSDKTVSNNDFCPPLLNGKQGGLVHQFTYEEDHNNEKVHRTAGCGIIQIIQLMNYFNYPGKVMRYNCSERHQGQLRQILPKDSTFKYVHLRNQEALKQQAQVIGLLTNSEYHQGWTETTNYGTIHALKAHLGFSHRLELHYKGNILGMYKHIVSDVKNQRPCLVTGGEHGFVCDGVDGKFLHFNFGWGGHANGWYSFPNHEELLGTGFIRSFINNIYPAR